MKAINEDYETDTIKMKKTNEVVRRFFCFCRKLSFIYNDTKQFLIYIKNFGDNGVFWKVNDNKFLQNFRDEVLVEAVRNRIDQVYIRI
jgi:hypothetical protein